MFCIILLNICSHQKGAVMKTVRIKNKFRFITFVTIMVLLISMAIGAMFPVVALSEYSGGSYVEVCVKSGDTLWTLAERYGNTNKDIREFIYEICDLNGINASGLIAGMTIRIPQ